MTLVQPLKLHRVGGGGEGAAGASSGLSLGRLRRVRSAVSVPSIPPSPQGGRWLDPLPPSLVVLDSADCAAVGAGVGQHLASRATCVRPLVGCSGGACRIHIGSRTHEPRSPPPLAPLTGGSGARRRLPCCGGSTADACTLRWLTQKDRDDHKPRGCPDRRHGRWPKKLAGYSYSTRLGS